jgi:hypothetical protein
MVSQSGTQEVIDKDYDASEHHDGKICTFAIVTDQTST